MRVAESLSDARLAPVGTWPGVGLGVCVAGLVTWIDPSSGRIVGIPLLLAGIVAMIDQCTGWIANRHSVGLLAVTLTFVAVGTARGSGSWPDTIVGIAIWTVPFFAMAFVGSAGGGDFKFAATLGAITGWHSIGAAVWSLLVALVACSIAGLIAARRSGTLKAPVRLGLPLYLGAAAGLVLAL